MLNIPKGVTPKYVEELEDYQKQIRIFIRNHQILQYRYGKCSDPTERGVIRGQIDTLEKYLLQWNDKQKPVLEKIREEVKRKRCKDSGKRRSKTSSRKATPSSSPYMSDTESNDALPSIHLLPGQFSGYITSYEKCVPEGYFSLKEKLERESQGQDDFILPRMERVISNVSRVEFMNNLELISPSHLKDLTDKADYINKKRIQYRNLTYIPELSEKKHKIDYNYWRGDYNASPPTLRTRARVVNPSQQSVPSYSNISTRASRSSSSRAVSPTSIPSALILPKSSTNKIQESKKKTDADAPTRLNGKRPERKILSSNSLITRKNANVLALEKKLRELRETIAEFGPRTISTRKERTRRNELLAEELKLSKKVAKLQDKKI